MVEPIQDEQPKKITKEQFDEFVQKYGTPISIVIGMLIIGASIYYSFGLPNHKLAKEALTQLEDLKKTAASYGSPGPSASTATAGAATAQTKVDVLADEDAFLGKADAKVTIIEFSDFQCPFCRRLWKDTLPKIKAEYIDAGKVMFVYRDFPLSFHAGAQKAAEAAECAEDQGKFWEMHDKIFAEQDKQGTGTIQFGIADLKKWARQIGLNTQQFNDCLDSDKYKAEVEKDFADGSAAGVTGTPNTFVNGIKVNGAQPYENFKKIIDEELAK